MKCASHPRPAGTTKPLPRRHRIAHSPDEIQLAPLNGGSPTWHGQSVTSRTDQQKYMTADPMICRATRKWLPSKSTIRWRWSREKKSSRCARSATIRWRGCTRIARSTRRNTRADGLFRQIGRRPNADPRPSIPRGNMSMVCGCLRVIDYREYRDGELSRLPQAEKKSLQGSIGDKSYFPCGQLDSLSGRPAAARIARAALDRLFRAAVSRMPRPARVDLWVRDAAGGQITGFTLGAPCRQSCYVGAEQGDRDESTAVV